MSETRQTTVHEHFSTPQVAQLRKNVPKPVDDEHVGSRERSAYLWQKKMRRCEGFGAPNPSLKPYSKKAKEGTHRIIVEEVILACLLTFTGLVKAVRAALSEAGEEEIEVGKGKGRRPRRRRKSTPALGDSPHKHKHRAEDISCTSFVPEIHVFRQVQACACCSCCYLAASGVILH